MKVLKPKYWCLLPMHYTQQSDVSELNAFNTEMHTNTMPYTHWPRGKNLARCKEIITRTFKTSFPIYQKMVDVMTHIHRYTNYRHFSLLTETNVSCDSVFWSENRRAWERDGENSLKFTLLECSQGFFPRVWIGRARDRDGDKPFTFTLLRCLQSSLQESGWGKRENQMERSHSDSCFSVVLRASRRESGWENEMARTHSHSRFLGFLKASLRRSGWSEWEIDMARNHS